MELSRKNNGSHFSAAKIKKRSHSTSRMVTFFLLLALFVSSFCYTLKVTIFSANQVSQTLTQDKYVKQLHSSLNDYLASLAKQYSIPTALTQNLLTNSQVKSDLKTAVENAYADKTAIFDTSTIQSQVKTNLDAKAQSIGLSTDNLIYQTAQSTLLSGLNGSLDQALNSQTLQQKVQQLNSAHKINSLILLVALGFSLLLLVLLIVVERNLFGWLHYLGVAAAYTAILLLAVSFLLKQIVANLDFAQLSGQASIDLNDLANSITQLVVSQANQLMIVWLVVAVAGITVGFLRR
ncbi:hypothetical protein [Liquorilactobacillus vini]|uniref:Uncharacterized protein n=1 Tax=Liquorilactobacillus vini DSM 20605 TaxID=1133569 RepID=A0A0R2CBI5_9LACO|nr:hypothetical protein [Liquorilactobacillus vini]KRM88482.1 hypothetical protein FD21_GL001209 [Liquorilactobacillus vini DSM 20605]